MKKKLKKVYDAMPEETLYEALDERMTVVEIKSWLWIGTVLLILFTLVVWGFWGTMQVKENVNGVLVRSGKVIEVSAPSDCVVLDVAVSRSDNVRADQVLVRVAQDELVETVNLMIARDAPQEEIDIMRQELIEKSQILTTQAGMVHDVFVRQGQYLERGAPIAAIHVDAGADRSLECLLFIPMDSMKRIEAGQHVNVFPDGANKKTYGNMTGTVSFISEYPVTYEYLYETLGSEELAHSFSERTCYEVALLLDVTEQTPTGFYWTTSFGPSKPFGDLTLCEASVVVDELRPIDVFLFDQ